MIINHSHRAYQRMWNAVGENRWNGAYYYSQEITDNIIPNVDTDRNWITVNIQGYGHNHSIVFVHNNLHPERYEWLKRYGDVVMVCGIPETVEKVSHIGRAIYLPLSIDLEYVKQFRQESRSGSAFVGRPGKRKMSGVNLPSGIDIIEALPRPELLKRMAEYENVYAVGRTAIEAKALGCNVLPYDSRYPDPEIWQIVGNSEAAAMLQTELDRIDGKAAEEQEAEQFGSAPECVPSMSMTKAELIAMAEDCGIHVNDRLTKKQIIGEIEAAL